LLKRDSEVTRKFVFSLTESVAISIIEIQVLTRKW